MATLTMLQGQCLKNTCKTKYWRCLFCLNPKYCQLCKNYFNIMISRHFCRLISYDSFESILFNYSKYSTHHCFKYSKSDRRSILTRCLATTPVACSSDEHNIVKSPFPDVSVPNVSFAKFIWDDNATIRGANIALVWFIGYICYSLYIYIYILLPYDKY